MNNLQGYIDNLFNLDEKERQALQNEVSALQQKMGQVFGGEQKTKKLESMTTSNPFVKKNGELFNPSLPYQQLLDNPNTNKATKAYIQQATGLTQTPTVATATATQGNASSTGGTSYGSFDFNPNASNLGSLDVTTELPKLSTEQIAGIISKHFSNSSVITPSDAQGIFDAQQKSGMSALAILGIGALESGWGTSSIAKQKNNLWGWNATNVNPSGNATTFSPVSQGALEFANSYLKTYYNGYGAKSIYSAGTGNNPSGKGYAYYDSGGIDSTWATKVESIMNDLYNTAKAYAPQQSTPSSGGSANTSGTSIKLGSKIANTDSYNNDAAYGQCVWYVRGRMKEKFGKDWGAIGNANEVWYNAPQQSRLKATADNIKPNTVASYKVGSSGSQYGHVIYIEAVDGDTVYFTEGGSGYHKKGTDGTLKKTTKQDILNGTGGFGSGLIGLIDINKL